MFISRPGTVSVHRRRPAARLPVWWCSSRCSWRSWLRAAKGRAGALPI